MKTLHFFGDSFTQGHALRKSPGIWPRLLAKGLGYKYKNHAQGGASPLFIIHQLIKGLIQIEEGDQVIVLETIPDRVEVYNNKRRTVITTTNEAVVKAVELVSLSKEEEIDDEYFNGGDEVLSCFNFVYDHRYKKLGPFGKYFTSIYNDFVKYFNSIGVKVILIPYTLPFNNTVSGDKFETHKRFTKGKNTDTHFTLKGHLQFAKYISETYFDDKVNLPKRQKNQII
jgi:hypothetical protein